MPFRCIQGPCEIWWFATNQSMIRNSSATWFVNHSVVGHRLGQLLCINRQEKGGISNNNNNNNNECLLAKIALFRETRSSHIMWPIRQKKGAAGPLPRGSPTTSSFIRLTIISSLHDNIFILQCCINYIISRYPFIVREHCTNNQSSDSPGHTRKGVGNLHCWIVALWSGVVCRGIFCLSKPCCVIIILRRV